MKAYLLSIILILTSIHSLACTCRQSITNFFLNQVDKFDAVVTGSFYRDDISFQGFFIIDKIYKGTFSSDTIRIHEGGTDCTEVFDEQSTNKLILGLYTSNYDSNTFSAPSCVTSVLAIDNDVVIVPPIYNLHISNARISLFKNRMRLDKFERKIKNWL